MVGVGIEIRAHCHQHVVSRQPAGVVVVAAAQISLDDRQNSSNHHSSRSTDALRGWPPESHLVGHASQPTAAREERRDGLISYPRTDDAPHNTNGAVLSRPFGEGE